MSHSSGKKTAHYLGYRQADFSEAYSKYYDEKIAPVPTSVREALEKSPFPAGHLPALEKAPDLLHPGYAPLETGFAMEPDGSIRVAILTKMPGVVPNMWDWWFGWHGCRDNRYKLWHPKAHLSARWQDGDDRQAYVGRTSVIEEYIGKSLEKANIRFIPPVELGFDPQKLADQTQEVVICARLGYTHFPLEVGWLVHQIRATADGAEMRSRFWLGGEHIQLRSTSGAAAFLSKILRKVHPIPAQQGRDVLAHCAEEMNHLAAFLPAIFSEFQIKNA